MSAISNMSLFIPHVFKNISKLRISNTFTDLNFGKVGDINLVLREGKNDTFHSAYIYFEYWNDSEMTRSFQERIRNLNKITKVVYEDPWYWIVLENKSNPYNYKRPVCIEFNHSPLQTIQMPRAPIKNNKMFDFTDLDSCKKRLSFNESLNVDSKYTDQLEEQIYDVTLSLNYSNKEIEYWKQKAFATEKEHNILKEKLRESENECLMLENINSHLRDDIECYKNKEWVNMV